VVTRLSKFCLILTLVTITGTNWALLQTVAWTSMLADNLCTRSLAESVTRTFDGDYPCPLCRAIAEAKKSEKKDGCPGLLTKDGISPADGGPDPVSTSSFLSFYSNQFLRGLAAA
jgi:hypothetical protein